MLKTICLLVCCAMSVIVPFGFSYAGDEAVSQAGTFTDFVCDMNFFKGRIPVDWEANEEITDGRILKEYGVDLKGPKNEQGAFTSISIFYFGPDHGRFKTPEDYLAVQGTADDMDDVLKQKVDPLVAVSVAGRSAKQFDRHDFLFLPIYAVDPVKIPMRERLIVVPAKQGFYVLEYSSSVDLFDKYLSVFEAVIASFKPNV